MKPGYLAYCLALGTAMAAIAPLIGAQNHGAPVNSSHRVTRPTTTSPGNDVDEEGQRVFEQNCARCHNAPDGFSPRITGTVVRHMRVRTNLSQHDEQVLLHYFNP